MTPVHNIRRHKLCSIMSVSTVSTIGIPSTSQNNANSNCDNNKFREVVFDFIERIGKELPLYEDSEPKFGASEFKQIELQIQAQRIEKVLELCVAKIRLAFHLSHLMQHQSDHLKLLLARDSALAIEQFSEKWLNTVHDFSGQEFTADLYQCLSIIENKETTKDMHKVRSKYILKTNSLN